MCAKTAPVRRYRPDYNGRLGSRDSRKPALAGTTSSIHRRARGPQAAEATGAFLKLRDEGWRFHLWENCNLGDPQLVAAARCERIDRQLKRGGLRFHRGSVASFIQRETAAAICIHANAPHQDGRQLNFWEMTGGGEPVENTPS